MKLNICFSTTSTFIKSFRRPRLFSPYPSVPCFITNIFPGTSLPAFLSPSPGFVCFVCSWMLSSFSSYFLPCTLLSHLSIHMKLLFILLLWKEEFVISLPSEVFDGCTCNLQQLLWIIPLVICSGDIVPSFPLVVTIQWQCEKSVTSCILWRSLENKKRNYVMCTLLILHYIPLILNLYCFSPHKWSCSLLWNNCYWRWQGKEGQHRLWALQANQHIIISLW